MKLNVILHFILIQKW